MESKYVRLSAQNPIRYNSLYAIQIWCNFQSNLLLLPATVLCMFLSYPTTRMHNTQYWIGSCCVGSKPNLFLVVILSLLNLSSGENRAGWADCVADPSGACFYRKLGLELICVYTSCRHRPERARVVHACHLIYPKQTHLHGINSLSSTI